MAKPPVGGKRNVVFNTAGGGIGGGGGAGRQQPSPQQQNQPTQPQQQQQPQTTGGIAAFQQMSDQQKANAVLSAINAQRHKINNLNAPNTVFQKFAHIMGIDNAPKLVSDAELDKMKGLEMYRSFSAGTQGQVDAITANVMLDKETFYSDTGGSAHGRGIYFMSKGKTIFGNISSADAALRRDIGSYGRGQNANVVRAKFTPDVRIASASEMRAAVLNEIAKGTAFGRALDKIDRNDAASIMACARGFNAMNNGVNGHIQVVLDRSCIAMSTTYHKITSADIADTSLTWKKMRS